MKATDQIQTDFVTQNQASSKHICLDFEGEGRRANGSTPHPTLLGALVPNADGKGKHYRLWLFDPELAPMTRSPRIVGRPAHREVCSLEEAISEIVDLAEQLGCKLVAFTEHEKRVVAEHLPETSRARRDFERLYFNIRPKARSLANRRRLDFAEASLKELLGALSPGYEFPVRPKPDVAEACRMLRRAGARSRRWRGWLPRHQQLAIDLVGYNRGDCKAVWKLVNRVTGGYPIEELE